MKQATLLVSFFLVFFQLNYPILVLIRKGGDFVTYKQIEQAVITVRDRYVEEGKTQLLATEDFGKDVVAALGVQERHDLSILFCHTEQYKQEGKNEWDKEKIEKELESYPPMRTGWRFLNRMKFGQHYWFTYKGNHYDADCPQGVTNVFELPFFATKIQEKKSQ